MFNFKIKSILYGQHRCTTYTNKVQEIMWSCCEISSFIILYTGLHIFEHSTCTLDFRILMLLSSVKLKCFSSPCSGFWIVAHHLNTQHATDKRLCAKNESYFCKNFMHRDSNEWQIILGWYLSLSGHAVAQLVEALRYKLEGRGVDSRWCHWNFSLT